LAEVLFGDGGAVELVFEDLADGVEAVEPVEDLGAGLAAFESLVELVAEMDGEAGDFAVARVHGNLGFWDLFDVYVTTLHYNTTIHLRNCLFRLFFSEGGTNGRDKRDGRDQKDERVEGGVWGEGDEGGLARTDMDWLRSGTLANAIGPLILLNLIEFWAEML
jgi:hypothetical protein